MFPKRAEPILFGLMMSCLMTLCVTFIATWHSLGFPEDFFHIWMGSWHISWAVAFPILYFFAPIVRKVAAKLVRK